MAMAMERGLEETMGLEETVKKFSLHESLSSLVRCKVCVAKEVAKCFECKFYGVAKKEEASALRVSCKICVADHANCNFCIAKAAACYRFMAAGGDSIETMEKKVKAWPLGKVTMANLNKITAEGGYIIKTAVEEGKKVIVTVRLPDSYHDKTMRTRPHTPLLCLDEGSLQMNHNLQENMRAGAVAALSLITREENLLAQYVQKGYATVELEIKDA